jgi:hypothetical protein
MGLWCVRDVKNIVELQKKKMHHAIDPYAYLGVDVDSDVAEIKSAYRTLAKIHHEDKGGDKETMIQLNYAYAFVMREKEAAQRFVQTHDDIVEKFRTFCKVQEARPAEYEGPDERFHREFANSSVFPMTLPGGYGDEMDASTMPTDRDADSRVRLERMWTITSDARAPTEIVSAGQYFDYLGGERVENFGTHTKTLNMSDYKEALSDARTPEVVVDNTSVEKRLASQVTDRERDVTNMRKTLSAEMNLFKQLLKICEY